jgi:hypothetical protein
MLWVTNEIGTSAFVSKNYPIGYTDFYNLVGFIQQQKRCQIIVLKMFFYFSFAGAGPAQRVEREAGTAGATYEEKRFQVS